MNLKRNLLHQSNERIEHEQFETLVNGENSRVERIVSWGHCSDKEFWYEQKENEWVMVIEGSAKLEVMDDNGDIEMIEMGVGDAVDLPAGCKHRVLWTLEDGPTVWVAVFYE